MNANTDVKALASVILKDDRLLDFLLRGVEHAESRNEKTVSFRLDVLKHQIETAIQERQQIRSMVQRLVS